MMIEVTLQFIGAVGAVEAHLGMVERAQMICAVGIESANRGQWIHRNALVVMHGDNVRSCKDKWELINYSE